jgi:hypothetical protein
MNARFLLAIAATGALVLGGTGDLDQQLRAKYQVTNVRATGKVTGQVGTVLVVRAGGLIAIPASYGPYWYCALKKGGQIKSSAIQHGGSVGFEEKKAFQVGEKVYLTNIEIKPSEIGFLVQSCGACDPSTVDPNDLPYRARLAFQFDKSVLSTGDFKQIQEAIDEVFGIDTGLTTQSSGPAPPQSKIVAPVVAMEQPQAPETSEAVLRNQDIIDLAKAGIDDATILAKIAASKCQFDTSTGALIELKKAGASATVIKAVIGMPPR